VTLLNARRLLRDVEHERQRVSLNQWLRKAQKVWHGVSLNQPDWRACSHSIALTASIHQGQMLVHLILNAYWEPLDFELPPVHQADGNLWHRWIDTALDTPHDIVPWQTAPVVSGCTYRAAARSVVMLFAGIGDRARRTW
jgi:glycogen operon protein